VDENEGTSKQRCVRFLCDLLLGTRLMNCRKDGSVFTVPITLIALHHGELSLPKVMVSSLPMIGEEHVMGSLSLPNTETHQVHGAEKVLILPRGGRSTFIVGMGEGASH
jgi:hypothetical protein